jgi:hypothetical protein
MNEDLERDLRDAPLAAVPADLDRRVEATIRQARRQGLPSPPRAVPLWIAVAACAACVLVGFLGRPLVSSIGPDPDAEPAVQYIETMPGSLPDVLTGGSRESEVDFFERERAEVTDLLKG